MKTKKEWEDYPTDELQIDRHVKLGAVYYDTTTDKNRVRAHLYLREDGINIAEVDVILGRFNKKTHHLHLYTPKHLRKLNQEVVFHKKPRQTFRQDLLFKNFLNNVEEYFKGKHPVIGRKYLSAWLQGIDFLPDNFKIFVKYKALAP